MGVKAGTPFAAGFRVTSEAQTPLLSHPMRVGLGVLAMAGAIALIIILREILGWTFLGLLIAVLMSFPVRWLSRVMPRGAAVVLVLLVLIGLITAAGFWGVPRVADQFDAVLNGLRDGIASVEKRLGDAGVHVNVSSTLEKKVSEDSAKIASGIAFAAKSVVEGAAGIVFVLAIAFFLVHEPSSYRKALERIVPLRHRPLAVSLFDRLGDTLTKWMGGIIISMTIMGTFTAVGLAIAGVKGWFVLGLLTFLGTFVPYAGALSSAAPGLLVAAAQSPRQLAFAFGVYLAVHVIEGYVVQPLIMKRAVSLKPAVLLFWQAAMAILVGIPGVVVATPLLACVQIVIEHLYLERRTPRGNVD